MPAYPVMLEEIWVDGLDAWMVAVAWAWDNGRILLESRQRWEFVRSENEDTLRRARAAGSSEKDIWDYHAKRGGNFYTERRTRPISITADSALAAMRRVLRNPELILPR